MTGTNQRLDPTLTASFLNRMSRGLPSGVRAEADPLDRPE
jgi:hypothetical protein